MVSNANSSFSYDARGRLVAADTAIGRVVYLINSVGERVQKRTPNAPTVFHYGMQGKLLAESNGETFLEYVYLNDIPVARLFSTPSAQGEKDATLYIHVDHLGTPRLLSSAAGIAVWLWDADAFGSQPPRSLLSADNEFKLRFPGQYSDRETTLNYNYYRDYDPQTGRYLQSDPIGLNGGLNTYGYVEGNPHSKVDPTGEVAFVPILIGIGVGMAFDYGVSEWKKKNCSCPTASTPAGAAGNGALGGAVGLFGPYDSKPRTGVAGGGPAGSKTSIFSKINHAAARSGAYSIATRNAITSVARRVPYASAAFAGYELYDAFTCD
ncbi:RHS repeat domain-containing protein [Pseudoduganella violacea]|uniref:RHS repeat-associated protein n=1 Tax=Pseudoduganella violacea TaxID=1715466 RepID=A0A7W5BEM3_9BURK|nr:RHS repeat-associated core domain-containing protein [Pseudoduganella violacea]MBB3121771.1 RHS repeat-associated protein [Pseudoduganella violacea]